VGLVLLAAGAALLAALRHAAFRARWLVWVLLVLATVDMLAVDRRITHPERSLKQVARDANGTPVLVDSPRMLEPGARHLENTRPDADMLELAALLGHERAWPLGRDAGTNDGMIAGVRSLGGYHPAKLEAYEKIRNRLYDPAQPAGRIANWLAGSYLTFDRRLPDALFPRLQELGVDLDRTPIFAGSRVFYRNRSALPRARLVSAWAPVAGGLDDFLDGMQAGREPAGGRVLLDAAPDPMPVAASAPLPEVAYLADGMNGITLRVAPLSSAILVLADMWMPGWTVTVDDKPARLLRADHVLRAVALAAGEHTVNFAYGDPALKQGLTVAAAGFLLILSLLVFGAGFARPPPREGRST
ncbi:YfhO family protein, partial [bacterium]|nr:YfhO family protein [bacterium]